MAHVLVRKILFSNFDNVLLKVGIGPQVFQRHDGNTDRRKNPGQPEEAPFPVQNVKCFAATRLIWKHMKRWYKETDMICRKLRDFLKHHILFRDLISAVIHLYKHSLPSP